MVLAAALSLKFLSNIDASKYADLVKFGKIPVLRLRGSGIKIASYVFIWIFLTATNLN